MRTVNALNWVFLGGPILPRKRLRAFETFQLIFAALLLAATVAFSASNWSAFQQAQIESDRAQSEIENLNAFLSLLKDAETGQRGYLLTGNLLYLAPYSEAVRSIGVELDALSLQLDAQVNRELRRLTTLRMRELANIVQLRRSGDAEGALREVQTGRGHQAMEAIRDLVQRTIGPQHTIFDKWERETRKKARQTLLVASLGSAVLFAFLCFSSITIGTLAAKRERVIRALRESRAQKEEARQTLEATLKGIGDAVIATDPEGNVVFMNSVAEQLTGWREADASTKPIADVFHIVNETTGEIQPSPVDGVKQHGTVVGLVNHTVLIRKDGARVPIDDSGAPVLDRQGKMTGIVLVFRDIGGRRKTERALEESERRYRLLSDSMPQIVWTAQPDGTVDYGNKRWYELLGTGLGEHENSAWPAIVHETDRESFQSAWSAAVEQGLTFQIECRLKMADSARYRWFLGRAVPAIDPEGNVTRWFGTFTDINDRKQAEAELRNANDDLSQFAFSASHDLQEPLRNVIMFTQLFAKRHKGKLDIDSEDMIQLVVGSAQRMEALIRDLLVFVRASSKSVDQSSIANGETTLDKALLSLQANILETGAAIERGFMPTLPIEEVQLQQLFQNLIGNSLKYRGSQQPRISIDAQRQNQEWIISVQDNGIGIDPQYAKQVFGMFKRLHGHAEYAGTGMGLAICQKIVERYKGRIWVESELGGGAKFSFSLPVASSSIS